MVKKKELNQRIKGFLFFIKWLWMVSTNQDKRYPRYWFKNDYEDRSCSRIYYLKRNFRSMANGLFL